MNIKAIKVMRCATYTRVSTDQGLEQDFNSLDAQYDACRFRKLDSCVPMM